MEDGFDLDQALRDLYAQDLEEAKRAYKAKCREQSAEQAAEQAAKWGTGKQARLERGREKQARLEQARANRRAAFRAERQAELQQKLEKSTHFNADRAVEKPEHRRNRDKRWRNSRGEPRPRPTNNDNNPAG